MIATLERHFGVAEGLIPMWIAEPEVPPPPAVVDALRGRVDEAWFGYETRPESIVDGWRSFVAARHEWNTDGLHVAVSPSVGTSIGVVIDLLTEPGDGVIIQPPVFTDFKPLITANGHAACSQPARLRRRAVPVRPRRFGRGCGPTVEPAADPVQSPQSGRTGLVRRRARSRGHDLPRSRRHRARRRDPRRSGATAAPVHSVAHAGPRGLSGGGDPRADQDARGWRRECATPCSSSPARPLRRDRRAVLARSASRLHLTRNGGLRARPRSRRCRTTTCAGMTWLDGFLQLIRRNLDVLERGLLGRASIRPRPRAAPTWPGSTPSAARTRRFPKLSGPRLAREAELRPVPAT